jgi:hypothetical protein
MRSLNRIAGRSIALPLSADDFWKWWRGLRRAAFMQKPVGIC